MTQGGRAKADDECPLIRVKHDFIEENGGGPGVRLRKRHQKKG
jgi:hypothetical protein